MVVIFGSITFGLWYRNRLREARRMSMGSRMMVESRSSNQINRNNQIHP
jgi:hypothetical protein